MNKLPRLQDAITLALTAHQDQIRKGSGIPYFFHLSDVTGRVAHYMFDVDEKWIDMSKDEILSISILHDYIEDQGGSCVQIKVCFGENVAVGVEECSRDEEMENKKGKLKFLMSFDSKSLASVLVKVADRYCNVHDYFRTPGKESYASKYALQAYPLYQALIDKYHRIMGYDDLREWPTVKRDLDALQEIVSRIYNFDLREPNQIKLVKELVT